MIQAYLKQVFNAWKNIIKNDKSFLLHFILSFLFMVWSLNRFSLFVGGVEKRVGVVLNDPLLSKFQAIDVTWITFLLIYGFLLWGTLAIAPYPKRVLTCAQTYGLLVLFRWIAMYLTPFDPPQGMILLRDPIVEGTTTSITLTKDLFFSGHTATAFMYFLMVPYRRLKIIFFIATLLIATCVLIQKVHYSIDVFSAFFFTYGAYRLSLIWQKFLNVYTDSE
jgi:hypothetical protein